jgi:DNA topoisomerase-1
LESCKNTEFIVESVVKRPTKRTPAPPFTTSTLQQEASRKLGFPVATTMRVAQSLYEAGWITYMRTDSMNLSQLCLNSCGPVIKSLMGEEYHHRHTYHTQAKGAQEAHEAIRPTDMSREKIDGTPQEKRLYSLIWKRTIASQMADAKLEKTVITITVGGREEVFQATGEVLLFDGFLKVYRESRDVESENENDEALLPPLSEGDVLGYADISARQRYSRQPMRYTEASLVHKMEELGIGRPSTYAPTSSTIQKRGYVEKKDIQGEVRNYKVLTLKKNKITEKIGKENIGNEKGKLVPTDIGVLVNRFLLQYFDNKLFVFLSQNTYLCVKVYMHVCVLALHARERKEE